MDLQAYSEEQLNSELRRRRGNLFQQQINGWIDITDLDGHSKLGVLLCADFPVRANADHALLGNLVAKIPLLLSQKFDQLTSDERRQFYFFLLRSVNRVEFLGLTNALETWTAKEHPDEVSIRST